MNNTIFSKQHLLNNSKQDFSVMFLPAIFFLLLSFVFNLDKSDSFLFFTFYIIDAGRLYSTFYELFFDKKKCNSKATVMIIGLSLVLNIISSYLFKGSFFIFLFYLTLIHHVYLNSKIIDLYSDIKNHFLKILLYISLIMPIIISHFRDINLGNDLTYSLRPLSLDFIIPKSYHESLFHSLTVIYIIYLSFYYTYLFFKRESSILLYVYYSFIYLCCFILLKNITIAMAVFVLAHGIPFYFFYQKRLSFSHSSIIVRKYAYAFVALIFIIGGILEANIEDGSSFFPPHINNIIFAMAFFPVTSHYIFNFFTWNEKDNGFQFLKNYLRR